MYKTVLVLQKCNIVNNCDFFSVVVLQMWIYVTRPLKEVPAPITVSSGTMIVSRGGVADSGMEGAREMPTVLTRSRIVRRRASIGSDPQQVRIDGCYFESM